ncbi:MAG: formate dehydrogenase subunit alpha [Phycisphaerae bacterium]|jgi:formate dehydrogenase alpha subunit|nr:formate dehydrogenase subunit alpha [Phycisphaerae bacterium]
MSDTITLKIDDVEVTVAPRTTILDAAATVGIDIPHLCHDPNWSIPPSSSCRLCLVEVEGARAPMASCSSCAADGMVVRTDTEKILEYRRMVIELLLSDHPQDCMTCEQGACCSLQEYAYALGVTESPYSDVAGDVKPRPAQDGPAIIYDRSKCILCGRCVEVCQNIHASGAIEFCGRGFDTEVMIPPGLTRRESTCSECGNCIDVCPTGAMSGALGCGRGRNWELDQTESICPYCGCGCTIVLNVRDNKVVKITGRGDLGVNEGMLCVKGRFGIDFMGHSERLTQPLIRKDGELQPAGWDEALDLIASRLTEIRDASGPDSIAGLASAKCTNEENYILQKFVRAVIGTNNVDHCARLCHSSTVAGLARSFGSGAMTNSIEDFELTDCIFVIGSNTTECHPIIGSAIKRAVARGAKLIVADPRKIELVGLSDLYMSQRSGSDVALINAMMHVILEEGLADEQFIADRTEGFEEVRAAVAPCTPELAEKITTVPAGDIIQAARMYARAQAASIVYSMGITQHTTGTDNVMSLANLAMLTGNVGKPGAGVNPLRGQNNVQGACDLGALPNVYPGYQKVDAPEAQKKFQSAWGVELSPTPGLTVVEMMNAGTAGDLKALYLMGENPMLSDPDQNHVREALEKIDFVVVQDIFLTETAELADVVLPAAGFAEKVGTFTNTERRVQLLHKAIEAPGEARLDWEIVCDLASRMGYEMSYADASAIEDEIASVSPIYGGIVYPRLANGTLQWPCPNGEHPGTPYLHKDKFSRGLGKFHPVEFIEARELPDEEFPILLTTGRILEHFHTGSMSRRSQVLDALVPAGSIEISSTDADNLGIADGAMVKVTSRRGEIEVAAQISPRVLPGAVFLAFHYRESPANRLTIAALDPIAKIPEFKVCAVRIEGL